MQLADGVGVGRLAQDEGGHVEGRPGLIRVPASQLEELVRIAGSLGEPWRQVLQHQAAFEDLVPGGDRRMNGEDRVAADLGQCVADWPGGIPRYQLPGALQQQERGVALVQVPHAGLDAERPERPHATDAQDDLLA